MSISRKNTAPLYRVCYDLIERNSSPESAISVLETLAKGLNIWQTYSKEERILRFKRIYAEVDRVYRR